MPKHPPTSAERKVPQRPKEAAARFQAHGDTRCWVEGPIVYVEAVGPFNVEGFAVFSKDVLAIYAELPSDLGFVNITEFRVSMMATPEAWAELEVHLGRMKGSGLPLRGTAWVAGPEVEGRSLFLQRGARVFKAIGLHFASFATMDEAKIWANNRLTGAPQHTTIEPS